MDRNLNNNNSPRLSYTSGFFLLIGLSLVLTFVAALIALVIIGGPAAFRDPAQAGTLRAVQAGSVLLGMFLPTVVIAAFISRRPLELIGFRKRFSGRQAFIIIGLLITCSLVVGSAGYLNRHVPVPADWKEMFERLEQQYNEQVAMMLNFKSMGGFLLSLVVMAFVPAVCEETLFRGGLQNFLSRATHRPWLAITVVSILFSLAHFSFYLFLPRMLLGMMLGAIYYYTRNIWMSITVHFINNALAVTQVYWLTRQGKDIATALNSEGGPIFSWGFVALPLVILLFRLLKRSGEQQQIQTHGI